MTDVLVPTDMWDDGNEASISAWLYTSGDTVQNGAIIAEMMVEKAAFELTAPTDGTLNILVGTDQAIAKGQLVAQIT